MNSGHGDGQPRTHFTSIHDSTAEDWSIIMRQFDITQSLVADNVLAQLRLLAHDDGGFPVNRLEHSLQTATRAERDGRDEEYILCALLHDIGDNLAPLNHPAIAAGILKPFVSKANHWMVSHHGIFQGYYFWQHIGLDPHHRERFRDSPYFEYTEEFCAKYDDPSFDGDYRSSPLEHFEPLVRSLLAPLPSRNSRP
ncbi:HD domain-containing protein [Amycolatopsis pithecellobii]|uniref:HD domain-containing protein n=1 Tax=Amycolatopsis pithecellobii TaxID=664692 RepID=A0A6N7Z021_9PSEU|nr:HD domain-containing protein [Amycolatopsis pithecellobii]MTD54009.1 HD domain-containing protein [Amycolatopsis pithecellobii]